jgi:site-specific DNA-cytosine methylase
MSIFLLPKIIHDIRDNDIQFKMLKKSANVIVSHSLYNSLCQTKIQIEKNYTGWDSCKKITNPFEFIHTVIPGHKTQVSKLTPLSRSFYKMIEISTIFNLCNKDAKKDNDEMKINPEDITIPERALNTVTKNIRDICEISLHDALKIDKKKFIDLVPENKLIHITGSALPVSGSPPTNLIKCYNEVKSDRNSDFDISFAKRKGGNFSCVVDLDGPSCTILCTYNRMPRLFVALIQNGIIYFRPFTTNELKQIQGFPRSYNFAGNNMSIIKQIGNAVPPAVVTEIINYLKQFIV